jgi:hypothetical protein
MIPDIVFRGKMTFFCNIAPYPPLSPFPSGEGGVVLRGGFAPSFLFLPHKLRIYLPIMEGDKKEESERGAASNIYYGEF